MNIYEDKKKKNVTFYLIHNNAISRIKIRKRIKVIAESLDFDLVEIFHQELQNFYFSRSNSSFFESIFMNSSQDFIKFQR